MRVLLPENRRAESVSPHIPTRGSRAPAGNADGIDGDLPPSTSSRYARGVATALRFRLPGPDPEGAAGRRERAAQRLVADAALLEGGSQRFAVELRLPAAAGNASDIDYLLDAVVLEVAEKNLDWEVGVANHVNNVGSDHHQYWLRNGLS